MATHDYNLANQDGASFRSDLNNALSAIVTNNSSSTAPATTFAHQIWVDTTANVIKQRNAANDAWIELWRIDGGFNAKTFSSNVTLNAQSDLRFADSDSSNWVAFQAPATVSSNVTWTLPSADGTADQALTTNGSGVLSWADAGGVQDNITEGNTSAEVVDTGTDGHFKVVTEGTEALRVDSSQRVGIGETSMDGLLVIKGDSNAASMPSIRLKDGTDTREAWISNAAGDLVLVNGGDDNVPHCKITLFDGNILSFETANTERFRIGSSGQFGIGGATYGSSGQVLTSQGSSSAPQWATPSAGSTWTWDTSQTTLGGNSSVTVSGIPSTAKKVLVHFYNISNNTNQDWIFRLGNSSGIVTSGYQVSTGYMFSGNTNRTNGFHTYATGTASHKWTGFIDCVNIGGSLWYCQMFFNAENDANTHYAMGKVGVTTLDRINFSTYSGTFDDGGIYVSYMEP